MTRLALLLLAPSLLPAATSSDFFELRIRPVLAKNCYTCHNGAHMGGLDLNSRESILKGGNTGPAIIAGNPQASLLIQAVKKEHARIKMPPSGPGLKPEEIADLSTWIKDGAIWPTTAAPQQTTKHKQITPEQRAFWSFQPVKPPADSNATIDTILGKSEPVAPKRTLLRRVTFDLTGLPPTPEEADAFLADKSPNAYAKVVDRLLASPHYGERWGRVWLDVARYSDDKLNSEFEDPRPNAFRYRDWVIKAFNDDMPYDTFVKAQIAGDLMGNPALIPGLGMYAMSPEFQDDRVDVTTRGFLGLTVACAQCHDHKFDPIPTRDFYSIQGIFDNSDVTEHPLAEKAVVDEFNKRKADLNAREKERDDFLKAQGDSLADIFAHEAAAYLAAARDKADAKGLDEPTLERWKKYLARKKLEHPFLDHNPTPADFQKLLLDVNREKKEIDEKNLITLGGSANRNDLSNANLASLPRDRYFLWKDFFSGSGVLFYNAKDLTRYLNGPWKEHAASLEAQVAAAKKAMPAQFPFVYALKDKEHPIKMRVHIRGDFRNLGEDAPPEFLAILTDGPQKPFTKPPRLELAESIADSKNPLTSRVIVNRIWLAHFGEGIVKTPSNFGLMGERPSNPALLDFLAWRLIEDGWHIKTLQREIVMSAAYRAARANPQRLEAEELRDEILMDSGELDLSVGGPATKLDDKKNNRRTLYGFVSRRKLDPILELFDFPNPNQTSEQRISTDVPLQRLFLLNSPLVIDAATQLSKRVESASKNDNDRVATAYRILFTRPASPRERKIGLEYLKANPLPQYLQALMASNEFLHID
ncbi:MAG TPA: PSD1 and planctomycete cytochrome C domain-containing protein [Bryobacteraceae bacterium]|jgi:hypothetical protein